MSSMNSTSNAMFRQIGVVNFEEQPTKKRESNETIDLD